MEFELWQHLCSWWTLQRVFLILQANCEGVAEPAARYQGGSAHCPRGRVRLRQVHHHAAHTKVEKASRPALPLMGH